MTFIDTADSYGPGYNEELIRKALHPYPEQLVIATKGGMLRTGPDDWVHSDDRAPYIQALGRPEYLRQQVEVSLLRLGVETIDLYQLHRIDPLVPLEEQFGVLVELQRAGKIRHIGLSGQPDVPPDQLDVAAHHADIVAVECLFNLADQNARPTLNYAVDNGIVFIPWFPLGHGELIGHLEEIAPYFGVNAAPLALAWLLRVAPNTLLIPGTTSIAHLDDNMRAFAVDLSEADWQRVEAHCAKFAPWRPTTATEA